MNLSKEIKKLNLTIPENVVTLSKAEIQDYRNCITAIKEHNKRFPSEYMAVYVDYLKSLNENDLDKQLLLQLTIKLLFNLKEYKIPPKDAIDIIKKTFDPNLF
jgi:hypothetical protein